MDTRDMHGRWGLVAMPGPETLVTEPYEFALSVAASTAGELAMAVRQAGTVIGFRYRIYAGAENDLTLLPGIRRRGVLRSLLVTSDANGKQTLDGDDDVFEYPVSFPVDPDQGDELVVQYDNNDAVNAHAFRLTMTVDYAGGVYPRWVISGG